MAHTLLNTTEGTKQIHTAIMTSGSNVVTGSEAMGGSSGSTLGFFRGFFESINPLFIIDRTYAYVCRVMPAQIWRIPPN